MDRRQKTFQFPREYQRHRFNQVGNREDLKRVIRSLMSSSTYRQCKIRYIIQQTEQGSQGKLKRMVAYLTCCGETGNRPIICFSSRNGGRYIFQSQNSIFTHHHHVDQDSESDSDSSDPEQSGEIRHSSRDQNDESQSEKNQENQVIVKQEQSDSIMDSYFPQFPQKNQVLPWVNQQFSQNVNEQNDEPMQPQLQPQLQPQQQPYLQPQQQPQPTNYQGAFQFPSKLQIEKFGSQKKKNPLRATFCNFIKQEKRQHSIKYKTQTTTEENQNQRKIFHLKFIYHCCNGINGNQPYLLFQSFNDNDYSLKSYNLLHYHRKGNNKKIDKNRPVINNRIIEKNKNQVTNKMFKQQQFEFPLRSELQELQKYSDTYQIKKAYQKLRQLPHHKDKKILFDFRHHKVEDDEDKDKEDDKNDKDDEDDEEEDEEDEQYVYSFNVNYVCCNGKGPAAFLTYVRVGWSNYQLSKNYNLTHIHDVKMSQMQQEFSLEKEVDQKDSSNRMIEMKKSQQKQQVKGVQNKISYPRIIPRISAPVSLSIRKKNNIQQSLPKRGSKGHIFKKPQNRQIQQSDQDQRIQQSNKSEVINQKEVKRRRDRNESRGRPRGRPKGSFRGRGSSRPRGSSRGKGIGRGGNKGRSESKIRGGSSGRDRRGGRGGRVGNTRKVELQKVQTGKGKTITKTSSQRVNKQKKIAKAPQVQNRNQKLIQSNLSLTVISYKNNQFSDMKRAQRLNQRNLSKPQTVQNDKKLSQVKQPILKPSQINQTVHHEIKTSQRPIQIRTQDNQRMIPQYQQINQRTPIQHQPQKNHWNFIQKSKNSELIIYWLQRYSEKLYQQVLLNSQHTINLGQVSKSLRREAPEFSSLIKNRKQSKRNWNECIEKLLSSQNIQMLEIPNLTGQDSGNFQYENILFVTSQLQKIKKSGQQPKDDSSVLLYIGVFPIKLSSTSQSLNLTIAYTLTKSLDAQLVWFCFTKSNQNPPSRFEDLLNQKLSQNSLFKFIRESIIYLKLQKVKFIYTTLNQQLIGALQNLYAYYSSQTSKVKIDFQMHFECINALITENFDSNTKIMQSVSDSIKKSPNVNNIMKSFYFIKDLLTINKAESKCNNQNYRNPRIIHQNYETFTDIFCQCEFQEFNQMGLNFLSSEYFSEKKLTGIKDPVSQIKKILNGMNGINILEEALMLLIVFFDPERKDSQSIQMGSSLIPMDLYLAQQQCWNYKSIFSQQQKGEYFSIESIISEPAYELLQIARKCPRIITQTIYRLIHVANQIKTIQENKLYSQNSGQQMHSDKDMDPHMRQKVTRKNQQPPKIGKFGRPVPSIDKGQKIWSCECRFYKDSGIPCENQILFALKEKTSLFKEIHPNWKHTL